MQPTSSPRKWTRSSQSWKGANLRSEKRATAVFGKLCGTISSDSKQAWIGARHERRTWGRHMQHKSNRYDVIVLGTGIGGSMLGAVLARQKIKGLMSASESYPRFTIGEASSPDTI